MKYDLSLKVKSGSAGHPNYPNFMETENSLSFSHKITTETCSDPHQTNPHRLMLFL
jgi:hypothetical protein